MNENLHTKPFGEAFAQGEVGEGKKLGFLQIHSSQSGNVLKNLLESLGRRVVKWQ